MATRFHCARFPNATFRLNEGLQQIFYDTSGKTILKQDPDYLITFKNSVYTPKDENEEAYIRRHPMFTGRYPDGSECQILITEAPAQDEAAVELSKLIGGLGTGEVLRRILQPNAPKETAVQNYNEGAMQSGVVDPVLATLQQAEVPAPLVEVTDGPGSGND